VLTPEDGRPTSALIWPLARVGLELQNAGQVNRRDGTEAFMLYRIVAKQATGGS